MNYEIAQQEIIKVLRSMTGKYNIYALWRDFLILAACTISNSVDQSQWERREDLYMKTVEKYDRNEANKFAEMLALVVTGLDSGRHGDFLGELYMQLEISNKDIGQFFTPYHVSKMMARFLDVEPNENGLITLNEPTCGSGGMIIAYAESLKLKEINYQKVLRVVCQDLDHDVVKMAYIQLSLMGIDAVIMQGNTLTLKMNEVWYTPMHLVNIAREEEEKQSSKMIDRMRNVINIESETTKKTVEVVPEQMSMFELGVM